MADDAASRPGKESPLMRQLKQFGLCFAGAGFLAASIAISRRSVLRMRTATFPPYYISNRSPANKVDSADRGLIAVRALGLATLNVMSFGVFLVGGISWGFDLSSVAELRQRTRNHLAKPSNLSTEDEKKMEQELEKILDSVYAKLGIKRPESEPTPDLPPEPTAEPTPEPRSRDNGSR